jgi:surface carbohydrate biosynthesis protein
MTLRVAIRAFTCRRDAATAILLAKVMQARGHQAYVCSSRNFLNVVRWWKPDIAIVNARGYPLRVKAASPQTAVILLDGEGLSPPRDSIGPYLAGNPGVWNCCEQVQVWGARGYKEVADDNPAGFLRKVRVVGNPHFDLARYFPQRARENARKDGSIGVVMRFRAINDHEGRSTLKHLPNPGNLAETIAECKDFVGSINAIRFLLEHTDHTFEIRPHPLEQVESYEAYRDRWFGDQAHRVSVDRTLSFGEFAVRDRLLMAPTSTSFLTAYLLGVPVIDLSRLCETTAHNLEGNLGEEWLDAANTPESYEELLKIVQKDLSVEKDPVIEAQLEDYCDYSNPMSSCLRIVQEMENLSLPRRSRGFLRLPKCAMELLDAVSFRRAMARNPLHQNMNYYPGYHPEPKFLDRMVQAILSSGSSRERQANPASTEAK